MMSSDVFPGSLLSIDKDYSNPYVLFVMSYYHHDDHDDTNFAFQEPTTVICHDQLYVSEPFNQHTVTSIKTVQFISRGRLGELA